MANSRKSSRNSRARPGTENLAARVAAQLKGIVRPSDRLLIGLSGGVDSVVLLDCLKMVSRKLRVRLSALHINHQLSPNAPRWSAFCRDLCRERGIPFKSVKVRVQRSGGLEAAARTARYEAYSRQNCDYIALAHHRDDQVETFLLQLLRGAGVKGLAAMPLVRKAKVERRKSKVPSPITHHPSPGILRPLLDATREEILEYARKRKLKWIEDESNADVYFLRNYLRHEVLPAVAQRFPSYRANIARSARHLAEAGDVLNEVAARDGAGCLQNGTLAVEGLRSLPATRARNLLRWFLAGHGVAMPATGRLEEGLRQALTAKQDAQVVIELDDADMRRYEGRLYVVRAFEAPQAYSKRWQGETSLDLPELDSALTLSRTSGEGISVAKLRNGAVTVRLRRGGERLQPDCRRPRRSLKNLLQEAHVAPWRRERLPLLFHGETLVWVPGIGVDCAYQATKGEAALLPGWSLPG